MIFELLQIALGKRDRLSHAPTKEEWDSLFADAKKQSVVGVAFAGVQKLPKEQWPPRALLFEWIGATEQIKAQNRVANRRSVEITKLFAEAGFRSCILKGQGNATMYDEPFCRMSGDIDIWVDGTREAINKFVRTRCPGAFEQEHHIDFPVFNDVEVEVHYKPCTLLCPQADRRFIEWSAAQKDVQMAHEMNLPGETGLICVPTALFNAVFQMAHIMIHFFIEGIGLRHFVDYYYALKQFGDKCAEQGDRTVVRQLLKDFGLLRFAGGVMWVEKECLGLEDGYLLVEPDERKGRVILKEMLEGGNFGHYDERYNARKKGYIARGITDVCRLLKLATVFPSESLWKIYKKVENQKWKIKSK